MSFGSGGRIRAAGSAPWRRRDTAKAMIKKLAPLAGAKAAMFMDEAVFI
jgi:hypothetical protein